MLEFMLLKYCPRKIYIGRRTILGNNVPAAVFDKRDHVIWLVYIKISIIYFDD